MVKNVYLTFDDGPTGYTEEILGILDSHGVKATFFIWGNLVEKKYEGTLKALVAKGHFPALHSMTHDLDLLYKQEGSAETFLAEMLKLQSLLLDLTGVESKLCRAPYGSSGNFTKAHIDKLLGAGLKCWDWNVSPDDWLEGTTKASLLTRLKAATEKEKSADLVVLLHEMPATVEALPEIIGYYKGLGYRFKVYSPSGHFPVNFQGEARL